MLKTSFRINLIIVAFFFICSISSKANEYSDSLLNVIEKAKDSQNWQIAGSSYQNLGYYYFKKSNYPLSLSNFQNAIAEFSKCNNSKGKATCLNNIGLIYEIWGKFDLALQFYVKALKIMEADNNKEGVAATHGNIAKIYFNLNKSDIALSHLSKELDIYKSINNKEKIADCLNNIGIIHVENGDYKTALNEYQEILGIYNKAKNENGICAVSQNIGNIYIKLNDFQKAHSFLKNTLDISKKNSNKDQLSDVLSNIGDLFSMENKIDSALIYINQSQKIAQDYNLRNRIMLNYELLSEIYFRSKNFENAFLNFKLFKQISDTIYNETTQKQINDFQVKYETENKEKEIALLTKEKEIKSLTIKKQFYSLLFLITFLVLSVILIFLVYKQYKIKQRSNIALSESNAMKDKLMSILGHDIKSPLYAFTSLTDIMLERFETLSDKQKINFIEQINTSSKNLIDLLDNILQWALFKSGKKEVNFEKIKLEPIIEEVSTLFSVALTRKNIIIETQNIANIEIFADRNMFTTIIRNLIANAVKFTNPEGKISIFCEANEEYIYLSIHDTGVGMDKSTIEMIENHNNSKSSNGTMNEKGTGLGLMLCKEFTAECKGELLITSPLNIGTTVKLCFKRNR
ncbi:MAG: tetratricopeptide repeat-containing sensor histidine kinase [Bacteroidota bacterium]